VWAEINAKSGKCLVEVQEELIVQGSLMSFIKKVSSRFKSETTAHHILLSGTSFTPSDLDWHLYYKQRYQGLSRDAR